MDYLIRNCREDDLPVLIELCRKHARYERASYDPDGKRSLLKMALFSDQPSLFCMIVECEGRAAGYASFTYEFSTWDAARFVHLDCLYIEPAFRGLGIGKAIIHKLKTLALLNGCVNVQWQTPVFNEGAIGFYKKIGASGKEKIGFFLEPATDT